jgi:DNA-binding beta-propeller fold protein YncE
MIRLGVPTFAAMLLVACASAPPQEPVEEELTYPAPPAEARFVFERTLRFNENVEQPASSEFFKRLLTGAPKEVRGLVKPLDIAVFQGRVYVTDTIQRAVVLFDIPGGRYLEFGKQEPGQLTKPTGIATSPAGDVFVADTGAQSVLVYDSEGHYLRAIGNAEKLQRPVDVAIDAPRQRLYVVDTGGVDSMQHSVVAFDLRSGDYIATIGTRGEAPGQLNLPLQACVDGNGRLFVVDSGNFRVQAFAPDGSLELAFGALGRYPGQFARPKGIACDPLGNVYVVDAAFGNFQIFDPAGQLLLFVGKRGEASRGGTYMLPAGIAIDYDGRIYVVDQFFRKVDIFRPASLARLEGFTALPPPAR